MPTIYLIRHAEAEPYWKDGDASRPLTARGRAQAQWMARHLKGLKVDDFRTAPHQRCVETASIIGGELGIQASVDDGLHISRDFSVHGVEGTAVWVAHSNNIPDAVYALGAPGNCCAHASAWRLEIDEEGRLISAEYTEPEA